MKLEIVVGDITKLHVDAIVNAANNSLLGGGGVDGAIHRAAGPGLLQECREIRRNRHPDGLPTGQAVLTGGHELPAKHVIHTVGPVFDAVDDPAGLLAAAYRNSLALAEESGLRSIAFPAISTGVYGYPREDAARVVRDVLAKFPFRSVERIVLCYFSPDDKTVAERILG
ncbi:MAG: O-acetyl-ADP-ribose deacetylase [Deltaproteobacteria bacterium]|nr:O-acetyl-ADP-ribose deacetylase [Deltaproteobacteria bacterium]